MILGDYQPGNSPIHRLAPGLKMLVLALAGSLLFIFPLLAISGGMLAGVALLYRVAGIAWRLMLRQLRPLVWIMLAIFAAQWWMVSWQSALQVIVRMNALLLLATLITLTTRSSDMIAALEKSLCWLRLVGINPGRVSLALSLSLRFIPLLAAMTAEVREAQKARGLERSPVAVAVPLLVRTLKMAEDISAALDARSADASSCAKTEAEKARE